ncbi:MAG: recombinase family protein [Planctomycetaceae bacterium]|nr:recombinase family protein [Planctomycetaceae bacterium]
MSNDKKKVRCAIYTRKSHEEGLDQDFNSLDAQRSAAEAFIQSQVHEGWKLVPTRYDDGGFSGGNMDRPALNSLIEDIKARKIDCVVVYKVDRLSRSLLDFSRLISLFDEYQVSFVSVTQQFNTTTSMGRLTLNILLSFAQFEREIIGERIRDKKLLTARQGKYIGGQPKLGFDIVDRRYAVNETEAKLVKRIFKLATQQQSCLKIAETLNAEGLRSKVFTTKTGKTMGGKHYTGRLIHNILTDAKYIGKIVHKGQAYDAEHPAILSPELFEQVRNVLRSNRVSTHKLQIRRFAMLRRLVHCSHCGSLVMPAWTAGELEKAVIDQVRSLIRHPDVIAHTYREVCAGSQTGPDPEVLAQLEELRQSRHQTYQAARSLLDLKDPDGPLVKSELKRLNDQMKSLDDSIRNLEAATSRTSTVDLAEITQALHRLDPIWEVLYPEEQSRILELLIETVRVSENNVDIRFRTNGIEKIVEELTSQGERSNG